MFHIRIKVSTTHMLVYLFFHTYLSNSYIVFFQNRIECTSCNFNSFHNFIITFSICILYLRLWERRLLFVIYVAHNRAYPF